MSLISIYKLSKAYGLSKPLFRDLTFTIEEGDRIGLIGPNGAGKSTLLKILSGKISANEGDISRQQGLRIGFLEQAPQFPEGSTIYSAILEGTTDPDDWESQAITHEYISKIGLQDFSEDTLVATLSGGWKKRVALARELVKTPDILFLDEPTNHMDIEGIAWLEDFLSRSKFSVMTITHDRLFLQRVSNRIIELDPRHAGGLLNVQGDYMKYIEIRDQLILAQETREVVLKNTLRRETEWLRQGAKARTTKQQARIKKAGELKEEVESLTNRNQNRTAQLSFVSSEKNPKRLIEAQNVSKSFEGRVIFENLNLLLTPGSRIGLLGRNGAGKSTLIRTLIGKEAPTTGKVFHSDQLKVAYFDQTREALDPEATLLKTLCPNGDQVYFNGNHVHIRSYLDRFLFTPQQMSMKVSNLSGGEQSRLLVARLMLTPANLLILDEPTNDLDIATLNILEQCLKDFSGALILVTHDRYFLDQVAKELLAFPPVDAVSKELVSFADFSQWEAWVPEKETPASKTEPQPSAAISPSKPGKLSFKEKHELENMEKVIHETERKLSETNLQLQSAENISNAGLLNKLSKDIAALQLEIERLYARWNELESKKAP